VKTVSGKKEKYGSSLASYTLFDTNIEA